MNVQIPRVRRHSSYARVVCVIIESEPLPGYEEALGPINKSQKFKMVAGLRENRLSLQFVSGLELSGSTSECSVIFCDGTINCDFIRWGHTSARSHLGYQVGIRQEAKTGDKLCTETRDYYCVK